MLSKAVIINLSSTLFQSLNNLVYYRYKKAVAEFSDMKNDKMKEYLKLNMQSRSGNKDELVRKCADGATLGAIPRCHTCGGGFLRFDQKTGVYKCPGYRDDEGNPTP